MAMTPEAAKALTGRLYARLAARRPNIDKLNRYFRGEQPLAYASAEWSKFHADRFGTFSDNWCGVVANSPNERLRVDGFRLPGSEAGDPLTDDERLLFDDWNRNEVAAQSSQGFLQSIIAKRSAVIVWASGDNDDDGDVPVITWETPEQVIVDYDATNPRRRRSALKAWVEDGIEYATLYLPDEVWKWQRTAGANLTGDFVTATGITLPRITGAAAGEWTERENLDHENPLANPMGEVPVVEFVNRPMLSSGPLSEIEGTIAMQDAINLLWAYLFAAADYASMPARVILGQEPPKVPILDENGQKIGEQPVDPEKLKSGRLLWLTGQNTKVDQFDAAKLDIFTDVINRAVRHLAAQTRTPVHYIVGEMTNVNGETLVAGEVGLVKKVEEMQLFHGAPVREVMRLVALVRDRNDLADAARLGTVIWHDAETRTTAQAADAALKDRQIGFPLAWIAERRFGMTPPEVERLLGMIEAERDDPAFRDAIAGLGGTDDTGDGADASAV